MTCAPVRRAVQLISESIGQLPVHIYERGDDSAKERAPDHPAYALLHDQANDWTPSSKFREEITRDALLYPNGGFAEIIRVDDGKPFELIRLNPEINPVIVKFVDSARTVRIAADLFSAKNMRYEVFSLETGHVRGNDVVVDLRQKFFLIGDTQVALKDDSGMNSVVGVM